MSARLTPMGAGDARPRRLTLRARLADVAQFAVRPTFVARPMEWGRESAKVLVLLTVLTVVAVPLARGLIDLTGIAPEARVPPLGRADLVWPLVFAPVLEELVLRGWLTGRLAALRFGAYGFAALAVLLLNGFYDTALTGWLPLLAVAIVFAGLIHWGLTRERDTRVPEVFVRRFPAIVWGSALLFGALHLGNFGPLPSPLAVVVVVPQVIGGMLLAYTRTRLGLAAAIAQHAAFNAFYFGLFAAVS